MKYHGEREAHHLEKDAEKIRALEATLDEVQKAMRSSEREKKALEARVKDLENVATKEARGREDALARVKELETDLEVERSNAHRLADVDIQSTARAEKAEADLVAALQLLRRGRFVAGRGPWEHEVELFLKRAAGRESGVADAGQGPDPNVRADKPDRSATPPP